MVTPLRLTLFPPSPKEQVYCSLMVPLAKFEEHPFYLSVCVCVCTHMCGGERKEAGCRGNKVNAPKIADCRLHTSGIEMME